jgi:hypothetical protein
MCNKKILIFSLLNILIQFSILLADEIEIGIDKVKVKCLVYPPYMEDDQKPQLFVFLGSDLGNEKESALAFDSAKEFAYRKKYYLLTPKLNNDIGFKGEKSSFMIKLIKKFIEEGKVSPENILIGGISNGGELALQVAGCGELPLEGVLAVLGVLNKTPEKTIGFKNLKVYLRIGEKDDKKQADMLENTQKLLMGWGAIVNTKLYFHGDHIFDIDWRSVEAWNKKPSQEMFWTSIIVIIIGLILLCFKAFVVWDVSNDPYGGGGVPTLDFPFIYPAIVSVGLSFLLEDLKLSPFPFFGLLIYFILVGICFYLFWLFDRLGKPARDRQIQIVKENTSHSNSDK